MTERAETDVEVDQIRLTLPALPEYARVARLALSGLASRMGFSYDEIEDLRIAVGEICGILVDGEDRRLEWRVRLLDGALDVRATRLPAGKAIGISNLTEQILGGVVDEHELDREAASVRVLKRRRD